MAGERSWILAILVLFAILKANAEKQKRQIFREQVLPSRGGKIPEEAFRADRLALNRLNKEGISVPDGVILDARHVHKNPSPASPMPEVLKVYLTPDGRYVPHEGRYHYEHPKAVDTTYLVQHPIGSEVQGKFRGGYNSVNKLNRYPGYRQTGNPTRQHVYKPIFAPLIIPGREELLPKTYYPTWTPEYSWDVIYEPFDDYFINSIALFNSHQILTDYEGFLSDFHDRSIRHIPGNERISRKIENPLRDGSWTKGNPSPREKPFSAPSQRPNGYPDLTKIPETRFGCGNRRGVFADVETKCQVFHQCGASGKNSFLCAPGTIFSEVKKRCEWWDKVACNGPAGSDKY